MPVDMAALQASLLASTGRVYDGDDKNKAKYFNLNSKELLNENGAFSATVRLLDPPGSKGYGFSFFHENVGDPHGKTQNFTCPKTFDENANCLICAVYDYAKANKETLENQTMTFYTWPGKGQPRQDLTVSKWRVLSQLCKKKQYVWWILQKTPSHLLGKQNFEAFGPQIWYIKVPGLWKKLFDLIGQQGADFLTNPTNGKDLFISYDKKKENDKYSLYPSGESAIPTQILAGLTDPSKLIPKPKSEAEQRVALQAFFPGIQV